MPRRPSNRCAECWTDLRKRDTHCPGCGKATPLEWKRWILGGLMVLVVAWFWFQVQHVAQGLGPHAG